MKDVRPSTWVVLGILTLFIFAPLFLLDIDPIQNLEPANSPVNPNNPSVRPHNPHANDTDKPRANAENKPANNEPIRDRQPRDNDLVD